MASASITKTLSGQFKDDWNLTVYDDSGGGYFKLVKHRERVMKRIKYSVGILLILAGFLFTGELSIYYLDNF